MADNAADGHHHKHKKHGKEEKASSSRPVKSESAIKRDQTARQMKLMQKWGGIVQTLREADKVSAEESVKVFDEAIEKIDEVKRDKEKLYLLEAGLPEMMVVVLETQYLVDSFHKKINELVQRALTFTLDSFEISLLGACKLMKEIFGHRYFSEVFSEGIIVDEASNSASGRELLTQSKRIKTLRRLNDALSTFCDQKGYVQLHVYLSRPHQSLDETRAILQVAVTMANYLNTNSNTLLQFIREANARLIEFSGNLLAHELPAYAEVKGIVAQLVDMLQPGEIGLIQELWKVGIVGKLSHEFPATIPILFMQHPERASSIVSVDPTNLQVVRDVRTAFCKQTELEMDEVVLKSVVSGIVVKTFEDHLSVSTMYVQQSFNVAYQIPVGWKRKLIQVMIVEGKSRTSFVPFYAYLRRKDLNGNHLYNTIIPSGFLFTVKSMNDAPFTLKAVSGTSITDIARDGNRICPELGKGDTLTIRVDWSDSAESSPLQANELLSSKQAFAKVELLDCLNSLVLQVPELRQCYLKAHSKVPTVAEPEMLSAFSKEKRKSAEKALKPVVDDTKEGKKKSKHKSGNPPKISEQEAAAATVTAFARLFDGLSILLGSYDLDICNAAVKLFHAFSSDTSMRDLLATFSPVPRLAKNLLSPSAETRQWSSQALTFFGHDTFFYQRPVETFETFEVRSAAPNHLNHRESEVLQFLYQVNSLRTVDPEFIEHATTEQLFWFLPLVFQTLQQSKISKEGSHAISTLRSTLHLLLEKLQPLSYLRQFTLWLKFSSLIDEREFDLEWAIGTRFEATRTFFTMLASGMPNLEIGKKYTGLDIMDPMHDADGHNLPVASVTILKVFSSKAKPCLLELVPADSKYPSKRVIFKKGDDLRQDLLVQACFYLFNMLWQHSDLEDKPFIHQYRLIPMGPDTGCVEFVQDSESLQTFSFEKVWPKYTEEDKSTLLRSAAGSYVAGWVMGVRDRHQDNMMVQHSNMFFHIDLGHIFNEKPTIDAPRFSIPTDLKESMKPEEWERFKDLCANGFKILHRYAGMLINLICLMFKGVVDDMVKVRLFLSSPQSLMVALDEKEATDKIRNMIESGVTSVKKKGKYLIHTIFVGSNGKPSSSSSGPSSARQNDALLLAGGSVASDIEGGGGGDGVASSESTPAVSPRKMSISVSDTEDRGSISPTSAPGSEDKAHRLSSRKSSSSKKDTQVSPRLSNDKDKEEEA